MLKSVAGKWKQPLTFNFSHGPIRHVNLVRLQKTHIRKCHKAGYQVIYSITDQGSNNCAAINYLMRTTSNSEDDVKYYRGWSMFFELLLRE